MDSNFSNRIVGHRTLRGEMFVSFAYVQSELINEVLEQAIISTVIIYSKLTFVHNVYNQYSNLYTVT